ncbi:MAG: dTDP-4-dehydrorhamnose reductase [bacterium]
MKYLIIGYKGQLGSEFEKKFKELNYNFSAVDIDELDITDYSSIKAIFSSVKPGIVINCAAYNDVDGAETNPDIAFQVNSGAVKYLSAAAHKHHSFLIHFSSDYVFDGTKSDGLYVEKDETNPINQYGKSKLAGEKSIFDELEKYLLFRLSWVYGKGTQNFIYKLNQWAKNKSELNISRDEISIPTSTDIIVDIVMNSIQSGIEGLYHLTSSGFTSRFDWAKSIVGLLGLDVKLIPVSQDYFNLPAKRPKFSAMSNSLISSDLNIEIPDWDYGLRNYLSEFGEL